MDSISKLELTISGIHQPSVLRTFSVGRTVPASSQANSAACEVQTSSLPKLNGYNFFIKLKPEAPTSLVQKQRRIPFALQDAVEKEIQKLLMNDIIEEIDSSDFVSPIVVVPKSDSDIRLCVDYKRLNQHIIIDQHPLPTVDEIFSKLAGARYFSKLDLRSAYHQLEIREDSRDYTAFICHIGLFRYKRLPFGLASAPSAYMKVISNILRRCKNTVCYLDDILIFGDTQEIHDECLKATLDCLSAHGMTLNENKCVYKKTSLQFLGRMIGSDGVAPLPDTLEAIINASVPHDKHSLRSFLGLANFYRSFIPNAALLSSSLYDLLKDNVHFRWTEKHQKDFEALKSALSNFVPLAFFNSDLDTPTFVTTDASSYGISAVLSQQDKKTGEERPVYFLSRKLSDMEKRYSVSEKEFLAVLWGVERLHQFLYGRHFTVRTDHQCLKQLLSNGIEGGSAPCRVIRWATKLLQYHFHVQYIPGKQNPVADALSRVPYFCKDSGVELFAVSLNQNDLNAHPLTLDELTRETETDPLLQEVGNFINSGWPSRISSVPNEIRGFWNVRNDLSIVDGVICRHDKFVIPSSLQTKLVTFAHEGHMGMSKCKSRLRELYWWPNMNSSVDEQVRSCPCCHENSRESPVQVPSYTNKPWHQLALDIKGPIRDSSHRTHFILVLIDCYTKFTVSRVVSSISSLKMTEFLKSVFSIFGHCVILTTDNGPQFISSEFTTFLRKKGIIHRRSSVYNPQSNGVVERFNRNLTKLLEVSKFTNGQQLQESIDTYVLNYNTTSHSTTGLAPSDLIFQFKSKSMLSLVRTDGDNIETDVGRRMAERSQVAADYANSRRKPVDKPRFKVGDVVLTKQGQTRRLIEQVGPFTFRLENGFCINSRNIRHRVHFTDNESENLPSAIVHFSPQTYPQPSRSSSHDSSVRSLDQTLPRSRPERTRKRPNHLQGYCMY